MRNLRAYLPAAVLFAGYLLVQQTRLQNPVPLAGSLTSVLPSWPGHTVQNQTVTDEERRVAGMTDYVARLYMRDTMPAFWTLVSYYDRQSQGKSIHSPRNCLPGAGWEILTSGERALVDGGTSRVINRYTLKNGPTTAVVLYWYQGRGRVVANEYVVKWNLLRDAALLGHTEEALVRVAVPVLVHGKADSVSSALATAQADSLAEDVALQLMRDVARVLPAMPGADPSRTRTASLLR